MNIEVSVIIPTLNSARTVKKCLESIKANNTRYGCEIIVADAGSTDDTLEIVRPYVSAVLKGKPNHINRNIGVKTARGDIICFTDSDCIVPENWIDGLVDGLKGLYAKDERIAGTGGGNVPWIENPSTEEQAIIRVMRSPLVAFRARNTAVYKNEREVLHNPPINAAYFRRVILEVGGYCEEPGFPEDLDLDAKILTAGYKLYYLPGLLVYHKHKTNFSAFARQMNDFGKKRVRVNRKHKHIKKFYHYGPLFLFVMLYSPLFFIPFTLALANAVYMSIKDKTTRLFGKIFCLTISFYRHYGRGELSMFFKKV